MLRYRFEFGKTNHKTFLYIVPRLWIHDNCFRGNKFNLQAIIFNFINILTLMMLYFLLNKLNYRLLKVSCARLTV